MYQDGLRTVAEEILAARHLPAVLRRDRAPISEPGLAALARLMHRGWSRIRWMLMRRRTRRALAMLDDRLLRDIGLTREEVARESAKPFWIS